MAVTLKQQAMITRRSGKRQASLKPALRSVHTGPWQRNFVDAHFPQFHMFPTVWSCTTTIGLPEFYIRVRLKMTWRNSGSPIERSVAHGTPLHGNNARGAKYAVYYASVVTHTVFENIKWLHSALCRIRNVAVPSLASLSLVHITPQLCCGADRPISITFCCTSPQLHCISS